MKPLVARIHCRRTSAPGSARGPRRCRPSCSTTPRARSCSSEITRLPEYYLDADRDLHPAGARAIHGDGGAACRASVIELGAGTATKTRMILDGLAGAARTGAFLSRWMSRKRRWRRRKEPASPARGQSRTAGRGLTPAAWTSSPRCPAPRLILYLGSSIGNFEPLQRVAAAGADCAARLSPGDTLLLGTDLVKDASVLLPAYDDAAGVTAAFNRNLLVRINRELGADFDSESFAHVARWNPVASRIEMHLESMRAQEVENSGAALARELRTRARPFTPKTATSSRRPWSTPSWKMAASRANAPGTTRGAGLPCIWRESAISHRGHGEGLATDSHGSARIGEESVSICAVRNRPTPTPSREKLNHRFTRMSADRRRKIRVDLC